MVSDDVKMAYAALAGKKNLYDKYWNYYDGDQPLIYNRERLREIFTGLDARFTENWCSVVVDSVLERINLSNFAIADNDQATNRLNQIWTATEMNLDSDDAHLAALVTGEAYIIVWKDDGDDIPQAYYNDPRNVHIFYESNNPRLKRFAAKWWIGDDKYRYMTMYYPDRLEYYRSKTDVKNNDVQSADAFIEIEEPAENPYSQVPVFHIRRDRRETVSELKNIIASQDAVNKLLSDMMVAAEFGAFKQRWAISQIEIRDGVLKNTPNTIWTIPASDGEGQGTQVGEFSATELTNYITAIEQRVNTIAIISRTPKHYFFAQGGDPSGEALIAMEAPLNKKAGRFIERWTVAWRKVAAFILELDGQVVDPTTIEPVFDRPETVQPRTAAEIRQINVNSGLPLVTVLRDEGWTQQEIDEMLADQDATAAKQQAGIAAAMLNAQEQFDRGDNEAG